MMADWHSLYEKVLPYIVRIETHESAGTGFLFAFNEPKTVVGFATAAHVVEHADLWKLPLKLRHHVSGNELFLTDDDRFINIDSERDSASILIRHPGDYLPDNPLPMMNPARLKKIGVEVAWVGYPGIAWPHLCLFTGNIAAAISAQDSYLLDGVAISGVSGGPVFSETPDGTPEILGTISSYMPDRHRGDVLPGMLRAQDVTSFQITIRKLKSLDEARRQKERDEREKRQAEAATGVPPTKSPPRMKDRGPQ
jgi:hypothetical protein